MVLGLAVGLWIGGFDLIYACQDVESDRAEGVGSLPARFGVATALTTARATHVVAVALFALFGVVAPLGWVWQAGVVVTAGLLVWEHSLVRPDDLSKVTRAFFQVNGWIALALGAAGVVDLVVLGGLRP